VRYNADGSLDTSFGTGGRVTTDFFAEYDIVSSVLIQPDGQIVAVGMARHKAASSSKDFALARYNADGSLDTSFGTGGKQVTTFLDKSEDSAVVAAMQPDGNIVVVGYCYRDTNDDSSGDFALARYIGISLPVIQSATIQGKRLIITGYNFDQGAKLLLNGEKQKTANDDASPDTTLIAKKAGKQIASGQTVTLQVQNADGKVSSAFTFTRP
jgi:uncharacterized delta-60 repeat protein